jgi:hypothetical protein
MDVRILTSADAAGRRLPRSLVVTDEAQTIYRIIRRYGRLDLDYFRLRCESGERSQLNPGRPLRSAGVPPALLPSCVRRDANFYHQAHQRHQEQLA